MADGTIIIDTENYSSGAEGGISNLSSKLSGIAETGLKVFIGTVVATGTALARLGVKATMIASDLGEVQNVVDVTFGDNDSNVNEWAKTTSTVFGISELNASMVANNGSNALTNSTAVNNNIGGTIEVVTNIDIDGKEATRSIAPYQYEFANYNVGR